MPHFKRAKGHPRDFNIRMIYELSSLRRALREEGFGSVFRYGLLYVRHMGWALRYFTRRNPQGTTPQEALDFTFGPAGQLIEPSQHWCEIEPVLALLHKRKPKVVVEIGTKFGGTLALWCAIAHPEATIISIDLPGGIHGGGYAYWRTYVYKRFTQPKQSLLLLRKDSHLTSTVEHLRSLLPAEIDFLFCDADHTYEGVKMDFEMYSPLVRKGGLVAFHDISTHPAGTNCEVDKFWREIRTQHKSWEFIENPQQDKYGIGVLEL
jgi:predicted O-methyltransferase YrrM